VRTRAPVRINKATFVERKLVLNSPLANLSILKGAAFLSELFAKLSTDPKVLWIYPRTL
jgi:hypothetical protein